MTDDLIRSGLKLRHLQIFREVLRTGSTRRAALNLGVSQPAVSQQVKQLEISLGFQLFERSANKIVPTRQAWELLRHVDAALTSLDRLETSLEEVRTQERLPVSIAAPSVFGFETLPATIKVFQKAMTTSLRSLSGSEKQVQEHVLSGRADIGLARLPLDPALYQWSALATTGNVCIFRAGHRFSRLKAVTAEDLVGERIIDIDPLYATHQMNIDALRFQGHEPDILVQYDDTGHEAGFVAAGLGVSITNGIIAREYAAFQLEVRPFTPSALYHYVAIWQKDRKLTNAQESLLAALKLVFKPAALEAA